MSDTDAAGRRALVTGAASGVGRACVHTLRARGYAVAALDLDPLDVEAEHAERCDVSEVEAVGAAVVRARDALGGLDAAAHCAGAFPVQNMPLHELDPRTWERTIAINLTGAYAVVRAVLPALAESQGALVLVASVNATQPQPGAAPYVVAKAGVLALARAAAIEYAHLGVRVNSISPGWIDTAMAAPALGRQAVRERVEEAIPLGRVATPEEVAAAIAWLLSSESAYVSGENLAIDGGLGVSAFVSEGDIATTWKRFGVEGG